MSRTRRYPNFAAFIGTGAVLGFAIGSGIAYLVPENTTEFGRSYSPGAAVLFMGAVGACVVGMLAAVVAVLLDRRD